MNTLQLHTPISQDQLFKEKILKIESKTDIIFRDFNKLQQDKNHAILNYYQFNGKDPNLDQAVLLFLDNFL